MADDQRDFWNGDAGQLWVAQQDAFDTLMQPVLDGLLQRATLAPGAHVVDVGCGTGLSALQAAEGVGPAGHVTAVDISAPMLGLAAQRTQEIPNITLLEANAASHPFSPGSFDHMISRFGVMFFGETEAAFAHLRGALKPGARINFATWGTIAENPWFTLPAKAAKAVLGAPPSVDPDAPGPFALRDAPKTCAMLKAAGFQQVEAETAALHLTPKGSPAEAASFASAAGPAKRTIEHFNGTSADAARIADLLVDELAIFETRDGLRVPAEINFYSARA